MPKTTMRKHPDGTLYPDHGVFRKWPLATDEEVQEHIDGIKTRSEAAADAAIKPTVGDSDEVKALKEELARLKAGSAPTASAPPAAEPAPVKDPDACESLEEAIAMVNTMTSEECNDYAERLGMPLFGARVKIADKRKAITDKMNDMAKTAEDAAKTAPASDAKAEDGE